MLFVFCLLANTLSIISVCLILLEKFWIHNQLASTLTFVLKLLNFFIAKIYLEDTTDKQKIFANHCVSTIHLLMNALVQTILGTVFLDDKLANLFVV